MFRLLPLASELLLAKKKGQKKERKKYFSETSLHQGWLFVKRRFSASHLPGGLHRSGAFHELLGSPLNEGASVLSGFDWGISLPRQTSSFSWVQCVFLSLAEEGLRLEGGTIILLLLRGIMVGVGEGGELNAGAGRLEGDGGGGRIL